MSQTQRLLRYYNAGRFAGESEDNFMFCTYRSDGAPGQSQLVRAHDAAAEREAYLSAGYRVISDRELVEIQRAARLAA